MAVALFLIAFFEASVFPIPPDILMIAILMVGAERWWWYAGITSLGSVLGAMLGYAIGWGFYHMIGARIVEIYHLQQTISFIGTKFGANVFLTVFTAAFTPIPFKVITIAAGLFKVSFWKVVFAAVIGRGMRYFAIAYFVKVFGVRVSRLIYKYFNILSITFVILLAAALLAIKFLF